LTVTKDRGCVPVSAMTYTEARTNVDAIHANLNNTRELIYELYVRKGWDALGYESWRECVVKEFGNSQAYLYRQLEAAQTEKVISPIGEKQIPESQLRPLTRLEPEKQKEAWTRAVETAPDEGRHAPEVDRSTWGNLGRPGGRLERSFWS